MKKQNNIETDFMISAKLPCATRGELFQIASQLWKHFSVSSCTHEGDKA